LDETWECSCGVPLEENNNNTLGGRSSKGLSLILYTLYLSVSTEKIWKLKREAGYVPEKKGLRVANKGRRNQHKRLELIKNPSAIEIGSEIPLRFEAQTSKSTPMKNLLSLGRSHIDKPRATKQGSHWKKGKKGPQELREHGASKTEMDKIEDAESKKKKQ